MPDLKRLSSCEHGTIRLQADKPAAGATAWVDAPVYADREKTRVLAQPLSADADGRLPGYVSGEPAIRARWRGREITSADAKRDAERRRAARIAEEAAEKTAAARRVAEERRRLIVGALTEHFAQQAQDAEAAAAAQREAEFRAQEAAIRSQAELEAQQAAEARERAAMVVGTPPAPHPVLPRGQPLTLVIPLNATGVELADATVADFEPVYDPNVSTDDMNVSPAGFGIATATGQPYYDPAGATAGEAATFGITPPDHLILVTK